MMSLFILSLITNFLYSQSKKEILLEIEQVNRELKEIKEKYEKEKQFFSRYKSQKEKLITQKKAEKKEVNQEIKNLNKNLNKIRFENARLEKLLNSGEEIEKEYSSVMVEVVKEIREKILSGAPFEKERRTGVLTSIVLDWENGNTTSLEILNRLVVFFDTEDVYSYDSQIFPRIVKIKGESYSANILRIGRVFFAADTIKEVYLYRYQNGKYVLDETPVSVKNKLEIQKAIRVIQGTKAPELIEIPIPAKNLFAKKDENKKGEK